MIIESAKKKKERDIRNVLVPIAEFRKNIADYIDRGRRIGVKGIVIIKILRAGNKYVAKNPSAGDNFVRYNKILEDLSRENADIVKCMDPVGMDEDVDELTIEDGYHLNHKGHELIATRVMNLMSNRGRNKCPTA
jgi:lysophospholipase L1-like esterase